MKIKKNNVKILFYTHLIYAIILISHLWVVNVYGTIIFYIISVIYWIINIYPIEVYNHGA